MSRWTNEEIRELVTLWPTNTASQIAKQLHRQRAAIRRKAMLLGLLSPDLPKHFYVNLRKPRPRLRPKPRIMAKPPPPAPVEIRELD